MGVLTPMDSRDDYAVTDPVYGVDGLRNVSTVNDLHTVSLTRRRSGMIVGVNGGEHYGNQVEVCRRIESLWKDLSQLVNGQLRDFEPLIDFCYATHEFTSPRYN